MDPNKLFLLDISKPLVLFCTDVLQCDLLSVEYGEFAWNLSLLANKLVREYSFFIIFSSFPTYLI